MTGYADAEIPRTPATPRMLAAEDKLSDARERSEAVPAIREYLAALNAAHKPREGAPRPIDAEALALAQTVRCRWCHAQPGKSCTATADKPPAGGYHATRLDDAQIARTRKETG